MSWADFLGKGAGVADDEVEKRLNGLEPTQCASMIYTSGYHTHTHHRTRTTAHARTRSC